MRTVTVSSDHEQASHAVAQLIHNHAREAAGRPFRVAISGGSTPSRFFELWAAQREYPWDALRLLWVDERCVAPEHEASNFGACSTSILSLAPIGPRQVLRMPGELGAEAGAAEYDRLLRQECSGSDACELDFIVLGMGADGHTASLFPGHPAVERCDALAVPITNAPGQPPVDRISLSLPVLNAARTVVFLVTGASKRDMVQAVLENKDPSLPAARVQGENVIWVLDEAAAARG